VDVSATAIGIGWLVGRERGSLLLGGLLAVNEGGWCFLLVYIIVWASGVGHLVVVVGARYQFL